MKNILSCMVVIFASFITNNVGDPSIVYNDFSVSHHNTNQGPRDEIIWDYAVTGHGQVEVLWIETVVDGVLVNQVIKTLGDGETWDVVGSKLVGHKFEHQLTVKIFVLDGDPLDWLEVYNVTQTEQCQGH